MTYEIATIPGDGIGPEVIDATLPLFETAAANHDADIKFVTYDWGSDYYLENGQMMPDDGIDKIRGSDSILLGAVGHPDVPDHVTLHGLLLPIRKQFNQQVCKRPSILFDGVESPLAGYSGGDIDFVLFRENTEGEYSDIGGREHIGFEHEIAIQSSVFTRSGTEAILRAAFEAATERENHLTSITKSNAQAYSMVFWDELVEEMSEEYPDVEVERILVDAASMDFIRRPEEFDVVVASNLFGDILTDIGAIVTGSMGLAPSGNINVEGEYPSMFEPVHGSAPDIMGEGIANPMAMILSGAMMFEEFGETAVSDSLWDAVQSVLEDEDAPTPPDLGGSATTQEIVSEVERRL